MQPGIALRLQAVLLMSGLAAGCHDAPAPEPPPPPVLAAIGGLRGPESVLHDAQQDVYFVSNLNGGLLTRDGNGFISRVDATTLQTKLKWIESGRNGAWLDAPKGMAIIGDTLYVSDIGVVRKFDRRSGAPRGAIALAGSILVNDLTTDGRSVYASDTGVMPGPGITFVSTGTDAIWKITDDRPEKIASGSGLGHPNGLDAVDGTLRVLTFGDNEVFDLEDGKPHDAAKLPRGQLDGLVHLGNGVILASSWKGNGIYRGTRDGPFTRILSGIDAPADIGYDAKRHRLLIPHSNEVTIHHVE